MKNIKKYKLVNPERFIAIITMIIFVVIYLLSILHIKTTTETKINKNSEISKEVQNSSDFENLVEIKTLEPEKLIEIKSIEPENLVEIKTLEPELTSLGSFNVTAYCCCKECCGKAPTHPAYGLTASGTKATEGRTIAVDPSIIPLGTTVYLNGVPYIAEDTGSAIKGKKIDLFINNHQRAKVFGVQEMEVKL